MSEIEKVAEAILLRRWSKTTVKRIMAAKTSRSIWWRTRFDAIQEAKAAKKATETIA